MKKFLSIALVALLFVGAFAVGGMNQTQSVSAAAVAADTMTETREMGTVSVNGQGVITVKPDIAYITIGVQTQDEDAAVAQADNAKKMTAVMAAMEKAGVKEEDMQTQSYSINLRRDWVNGEQGDPYYMVSNSLKVTVRDLDTIGDLIDTAAQSGANNINAIRFALEDDSAVYQEALTLAMENAKGKATTIFNTMDVMIGKPSKVSETSWGGPVYRDAGSMNFAAEASAKSFSTPIQSGDLTVTANVSVEYEYEK